MGQHRKSHVEFAALRLWSRLALVCAIGCLAGLLFLKWIFWRDLGAEYAQSFYTLKSMSTYLVPTLALSLLIVLMIASVAVFGVVVLASHKVAGPMFRIQRVGEHLDKSILIGRIVLREGDWLAGLSDKINKWVENRKQIHNANREWAEDAHQAIRAMKVAAGQSDFAGARGVLASFVADCDSDPAPK